MHAATLLTIAMSVALNAPLDRMPPYSEEAERGLLGSALLDSAACAEQFAAVTPDDFYLPDHRLLWAAALSRYTDGQPIDALTLTADPTLSRIPADYLLTLRDGVPHAANAAEYARVIREKALARHAIAAASECLRDCYAGENSAAIVNAAAEKFLALSMHGTDKKPRELRDVLQDAFDLLEAMRSGKMPYNTTGFRGLDFLIHGLFPGEFVIIAGRPSMGKTTFGFNLCLHLAREEKRSAIFSLEVSDVQLGLNMLSAWSRVPTNHIREGHLNEFEMSSMLSATGILSNYGLWIHDASTLTIAELVTHCRNLKHRHDIQAVMVDYLQLMGGPADRYEGREKEISHISRGLKALARELGICVIGISQLSRKVEDRPGNRPRAADLRESGSLEQDADVILLLYREAYYKEAEADNRRCEVIVAKQRHGPTGTAQLIFNREYLRFDDATSEEI